MRTSGGGPGGDRDGEGRNEDSDHAGREDVLAGALLATNEENEVPNRRNAHLATGNGESCRVDARDRSDSLRIALGRVDELENVDNVGGIALGVGLTTSNVDEVGGRGDHGRLNARTGEGKRVGRNAGLELSRIQNVHLERFRRGGDGEGSEGGEIGRMRPQHAEKRHQTRQRRKGIGGHQQRRLWCDLRRGG